jgi:cytoskeletal protein CcmA (bactofilin family)
MTIGLMPLGALLGLALPAEAQVYPDRIRSTTRKVIESTRAEVYQRNQQREEQTDRTTRTLHIGDNGEIDLGNISGDIVITRGSGGDATIEIVKRSRGRTAEEARQGLQLVQVDVVERGTRAEVRVRYPRGDDRRNNVNVSVAFNVTAPERARIMVNTISGNISVRDIKGDLGLETISGDIRVANAGRVSQAKTISGNVEIADTTVEGAMDASTVSGTLLLRKLTARRLELHSVSGNIDLQDVSCERIDAQSVSGNVHLTGNLLPSGRYGLGSHSGEIRVAVSGGVGFEVEATSFSGSVRAEMPLTLQGTTEGRRNRAIRGTVGDGSAILNLTTFSGSIVIGRR